MDVEVGLAVGKEICRAGKEIGGVEQVETARAGEGQSETDAKGREGKGTSEGMPA